MILKKCNLCYNSFNRYLQGLVRRVLPFDSEPAVMPPVKGAEPASRMADPVQIRGRQYSLEERSNGAYTACFSEDPEAA